MVIKLGDWLTVKTKKHKYTGYIVELKKVDFEENILYVKITNSTEESIIGKVRKFSYNNDTKYNFIIYPEYVENEHDIDNLVDIAIITNDREWFNELAKRKSKYAKKEKID